MTRFRAYVSDSDEEENASYDEVDHELEEGSESESSQHPGPAEDEPPEEEEDQEDEDGGDADAEGEEEEENDENSPPPLISIKDPTITPWAREIGVESQKMHNMQASFFRASEEAAALHAAARAPLPRRPWSGKTLHLPGSVSTPAKHDREPEAPIRRAPPRQVRITGLND